MVSDCVSWSIWADNIVQHAHSVERNNTDSDKTNRKTRKTAHLNSIWLPYSVDILSTEINGEKVHLKFSVIAWNLDNIVYFTAHTHPRGDFMRYKTCSITNAFFGLAGRDNNTSSSTKQTEQITHRNTHIIQCARTMNWNGQRDNTEKSVSLVGIDRSETTPGDGAKTMEFL